jgi:D-glycero-alpha-D-manno-heptose 1-phosphate guanylyltransferase
MKECIILAGGLGTRLRSAVPDLPKCMAPVAGKPFLAYVIDYFRKQGIERFIFSLGYMHEVIEAFVQTQYPMLNVAYSIEQEPMGTGGAIKLACSKAQQKDVLVLNGDTIFTIQLDQLTTFHTSHAADCTLSLKPMQQFDRYGVVELAADHTISDFREKQYYESGYINGGVYALNVGSFLQETLPEKFSFEKDYLENLYAQRKMYGLAQDAYFIDIGIPADYEKANQEFRVMNL